MTVEPPASHVTPNHELPSRRPRASLSWSSSPLRSCCVKVYQRLPLRCRNSPFGNRRVQKSEKQEYRTGRSELWREWSHMDLPLEDTVRDPQIMPASCEVG